ncbi:MAG: hypothetical protein GWN01_03850, partial [Nitrosopumilaceae archaeon]|nr:hypothetical protein [Nitrosopumilaceae archaeon]NIU86478.1 hypothetical protein [Nitrosopumilaceae archaeon]NIV65241.1 hypothetical protein [Nitrosopumilaceae archaeon]NIX60692.1 hypothetical protein [Nitrosopumilaceae archaeon]
MKRTGYALVLAVMLLMPVYASGQQQSDRISLLDDFGVYERGEHLFVVGKV